MAIYSHSNIKQHGKLPGRLTEQSGILREELGQDRQDPPMLPHDGLHQRRDPSEEMQSSIAIGLIFEMGK